MRDGPMCVCNAPKAPWTSTCESGKVGTDDGVDALDRPSALGTANERDLERRDGHIDNAGVRTGSYGHLSVGPNSGQWRASGAPPARGNVSGQVQTEGKPFMLGHSPSCHGPRAITTAMTKSLLAALSRMTSADPSLRA